MPEANDFKVGELVRMKDAEDQPKGAEHYTNVFGHICVVEGFRRFEFSPDCLYLRSLGNNRTFTCWVERVEKHDG